MATIRGKNCSSSTGCVSCLYEEEEEEEEAEESAGDGGGEGEVEGILFNVYQQSAQDNAMIVVIISQCPSLAFSILPAQNREEKAGCANAIQKVALIVEFCRPGSALRSTER